MSNPTRTQAIWLAPGETLDIGWDWAAWLTTGDTVASVAVVGTGVTVGAVTHDTTRTVARISGGVAGTPGVVTTTVTTTGGEKPIGVHKVTVG